MFFLQRSWPAASSAIWKTAGRSWFGLQMMSFRTGSCPIRHTDSSFYGEFGLLAPPGRWKTSASYLSYYSSSHPAWSPKGSDAASSPRPYRSPAQSIGPTCARNTFRKRQDNTMSVETEMSGTGGSEQQRTGRRDPPTANGGQKATESSVSADGDVEWHPRRVLRSA